MTRTHHERKGKSWAYLNEKGKQEWGDVFNDDIIPVVSFIPQNVSLGEDKIVEPVYLVYLPEIDDIKFDKVIKKLSDKFNVGFGDMEKVILAIGLPIRASLIRTSGTNNLGLLL